LTAGVIQRITRITIMYTLSTFMQIGVVTTASDLQKLATMILQRGKHFDGSSWLQVLTEAAVTDLVSYQELGDTKKDAIFAQVGNCDNWGNQ
jgi:hypothetical protein